MKNKNLEKIYNKFYNLSSTEDYVETLNDYIVDIEEMDLALAIVAYYAVVAILHEEDIDVPYFPVIVLEGRLFSGTSTVLKWLQSFGLSSLVEFIDDGDWNTDPIIDYAMQPPTADPKGMIVAAKAPLYQVNKKTQQLLVRIAAFRKVWIRSDDLCNDIIHCSERFDGVGAAAFIHEIQRIECNFSLRYDEAIESLISIRRGEGDNIGSIEMELTRRYAPLVVAADLLAEALELNIDTVAVMEVAANQIAETCSDYAKC